MWSFSLNPALKRKMHPDQPRFARQGGVHNKNIICCIALDSALEEKNSLNVQNICLEVLEMHFNMNFKHILSKKKQQLFCMTYLVPDMWGCSF